MIHIDLKRTLTLILAGAVIIISCFLIILYFADVCVPEKMYINAAGTGRYLCPACVLSFAAAVVYLSYRLGGSESDAARGGLVLAVLPHAVIILSLLLEVLTVTNFFNHAMELLTSDISKSVMLVYATISLLMSAALCECAIWKRK